MATAGKRVHDVPRPQASHSQPSTSQSRLTNAIYGNVRNSKQNYHDIVELAIEVTIESIDMPKAKIPESRDSYPQLYVTVLRMLAELVLRDTAGVLTTSRRGLVNNYGCVHVDVADGGSMGGLILRTGLPRAKLVALQCEQSSGQLAKDLQGWLVTRQVLAKLGVVQITLATDVRNA